jgi:arylsulfatase
MTKPNIILIMTDQQRIDSIRAWGHSHMTTPGMDRIAQNGISFRQAFCPGATCIASRAAIFTGMYAHNTGVYTFLDWSHQPNWVQDLAQHGYHCVNIGKMHFAPEFEMGGFHERVVVENPTSAPSVYGGKEDAWGEHLKEHGAERPIHRQATDPDWFSKHQAVPWHLGEKLHSDVFIGDSALKWIQNHQVQKPVFLQIGFTGPHEPYDPLPRHLKLYQDKDVPPAIFPETGFQEKPPQFKALDRYWHDAPGEAAVRLSKASPKDIEKMRRHYYAKVTTVDEKVDQILNELEKRGYLKNALVIFCSDHGDMLGDHQLPYKWLMTEPVVRVPLMIWDTRQKEQKKEVSDLVSLIDLAPTILEAAGLKPAAYHEGKSLMGYLEGKVTSPQPYVFCEDNYLHMIRSKTHKLVHYLYQDQGELYDLEKDPNELKNLWDDPQYQTIKLQLTKDLFEWMARGVYEHAGYKAAQLRNYRLRNPQRDPSLQGNPCIERD